MSDNVARSIVKTITWRITGSSSTFLIAYLLTDNISAAGAIAIIQLLVNTILYYIHERLYGHIAWGKK
jgi:uncharacterized membrane protein